MVAFAGTEPPAGFAATTRERPIAGVTLFRTNVASARQVRALTESLQAAARPPEAPLLIAADQETGQLVGMGDDTTPFAGAMALGAVGDEDLAERVARAIGRELRALGVNVDYAPVCDLATNPAHPALGIRSFGDDPQAVARLVAATVRGLQAEGVAATAKHFPGNGEGAVDSHHALAVVAGDREALEARELVPFRAAISAGARLVMAGHFAVPDLTGDESLPASLSGKIVTQLLRDELGFTGLTITDALDMHALAQGVAQIVDVICAVRAGEDLLLATPDEELLARLEAALTQAERRRLIDSEAGRSAHERLAATRAWLAAAPPAPGLETVGCAAHRSLAAELAARSITLVRNDDALLPLRLGAGARIAVIQPRPVDLTPADTSSYVPALLAKAIRAHHRATDLFIVEPLAPPDSALLERLRDYDAIILGTVSANILPAQADLASRVLALGVPTVAVALRTPWDLLAYPTTRTYVCSYGILGPTIEALAAALFGTQDMSGHLPVRLGDLHPRGHGLEQSGRTD